jgi:large subunit ribosomal protein L3
MGGHMGTTTVSVKGLRVFEVKPEENTLVVQGLIPGAKGGLVKITKLV